MPDVDMNSSGPQQGEGSDYGSPAGSQAEREQRLHERAKELLAVLDSRDPPSANYYPPVVERFIQLPPYVRKFLQDLTVRDVATLTRSILNIQRTGFAFRKIRRIVAWMLGAFGAMVLFGKQFSEALQLVRGWLW
jgi:hypothetical protein